MLAPPAGIMVVLQLNHSQVIDSFLNRSIHSTCAPLEETRCMTPASDHNQHLQRVLMPFNSASISMQCCNMSVGDVLFM